MCVWKLPYVFSQTLTTHFSWYLQWQHSTLEGRINLISYMPYTPKCVPCTPPFISFHACMRREAYSFAISATYISHNCHTCARIMLVRRTHYKLFALFSLMDPSLSLFLLCFCVFIFVVWVQNSDGTNMVGTLNILYETGSLLSLDLLCKHVFLWVLIAISFSVLFLHWHLKHSSRVCMTRA